MLALSMATNCAAVLVRRAVSLANCKVETIAGQTARPNSDAPRRDWNTKVKPTGNCSTKRRKDLTWNPEPKRPFEPRQAGLKALSESKAVSEPMWNGLHV